MTEDKKTTIINNINPYKNPITSLFGGIFTIAGLGVILLPLTPYFFEVKTPIPQVPLIPEWTGWALMGAGILLILAPEKVVSFLSRKSEQV